MSRGRKIPGVDENALETLAKQFPGSETTASTGASPELDKDKADPLAPARPKATGADKTKDAPAANPKVSAAAAKARSKPVSAIKAKPAVAVSSANNKAEPQVSARGRGLAMLSLLISMIAVVLALAILAPSQLRPWLQSKIDDPRIVDFLTGARYAVDQKFTATDATLDNLHRQLADITAKVAEIEAVGGSNEAAAKRVIAVENSLGAIHQGIAADGEKITAVGGAQVAIAARVGTLEQQDIESAARMGKIAGAVEQQGIESAARMGEIAGAVDSLQAIVLPQLSELVQSLQALENKAAGSQKLYLIALKIRVAMQTSSPFLSDVAAAQALAGDSIEISTALKQLAAAAATGAPTVEQLSMQFNDRLAPRLRQLDQAAPRSLVSRLSSWVDGFMDRPVANMSDNGMTENAIIDLAQESLSRGNLGVAVERLGALKGFSAVVLTEWIKDAKTRIAMDQAAAVLMRKSFDGLLGKN